MKLKGIDSGIFEVKAIWIKLTSEEVNKAEWVKLAEYLTKNKLVVSWSVKQ